MHFHCHRSRYLVQLHRYFGVPIAMECPWLITFSTQRLYWLDNGRVDRQIDTVMAVGWIKLYLRLSTTILLWFMESWLTHWGRVTHICVVKLTIIGSDNGLSPGQRQAIIWTNAGILSIGPLGTNFIEILIGIQAFPFTKMHLKDVVCEMASILLRA